MKMIDVKAGLAFPEELHGYTVDVSALESQSITAVIFPDQGQSWIEREPFQGREQDSNALQIATTIMSEAEGYHEASEPAPLTPAEALQAERANMIVSRFQARAALLQNNLLETAAAAIAQGDALSQLAWEDAQEFRRNSPLVASIAGALGLTDGQLDDLFRLAQTIEA